MNTLDTLDALIQDAKLALDTIENANSDAFRAAAATWLAAIAGQMQTELTKP
jgi:hypothetical protein